MALVRWNPWSDIFSLQNQVDQLLQSVNPESEARSGAELFNLPVDIRQTEDAFVIEASVPGFEPDDVEVTFEDGVLTIRATHRDEREDKRDGYVRRERRIGSLYRQIGLPAEVRADDISASFRNGVLTVTVPRAPKAQPKRIRVSPESAESGQGAGGTVLEGTSASTGSTPGGASKDRGEPAAVGADNASREDGSGS
jgi:HSP20 family protein